MKPEIVNKILQETEAGYDLMAEKFSETRKFFWRGLEFIKDYVKEGDKVLDFGCGNGRLLELFSSTVQPLKFSKVEPLKYFGVDISQKLINLAKSKYSGENIKFQKTSSSTRLTFPDNYFNAVYSIAVFHHLPGKESREFWAKELYRVMQSGGHIVITVWNLYQRKYLKNIIKNWIDKISGRSNLDWNDCYINFKNNEGRIFSRYHHAFTKRELKKLFLDAGFTIEECKIVDERNIILIAKK